MSTGSLTEFADFTASTSAAYLNDQGMGAAGIVNDSGLRNYAGIDLFTKSQRKLGSGSSIKANIILDRTQRAVHHEPGHVFTLDNDNYVSTWNCPWRFTTLPVPILEQEVMLNDGSSQDAIFAKYTDVRNVKLTGAYTDMLTKIELALLANYSTDMESTTQTSKTPYSIFAGITSDGLAASGSTTFQQINPTVKSNWRNQTSNWSISAWLDPKSGLIAGMDNIAEKTKFKAPARNGKFFTESGLEQMSILTNKQGRNYFAEAIRANNDYTRYGAQDPAYPNPTFNGIDVLACEAFDENSTFTDLSPGYLFVNGKFLTITCRKDRWMHMSKVLTPANQFEANVFYITCWWNLTSLSKKRHGYLAAAA